MQQRDHVLVVEDDPDISELLHYNLTREGFEISVLDRGDEVAPAVAARPPALIILDLMLPGLSGLEVCRNLRQSAKGKLIPVIMLTARGEESDRVVGLEFGADDYMTKPFSVRELMARVRAMLRRAKGSFQQSQVIEVGPVMIDTERHLVSCAGERLLLTLAEFKLIRALAKSAGRVLSRDQLLDHITGGEAVVIDRNVDVHIRGVRKKLGSHAAVIETVRGVGYRFVEA